jgi:two-component system, cell cycle sensor histidine kinase and response regulator CckA
VVDDGTGMTPEVRARIFDPFYSTRFTGRGLGLPAVQGIVHGHQGVIRVLTEPGQGTTVRVLLPAIKGPVSVPDPSPEPTGEAPTRPGTILVADDESPVRELVRRALEREGFAVLTAADGREAVTVFRSHGLHIDVVLLDLTMPHLDGIETMAELRRIRPDIRVILASGFSEQQASERVGGQAPTAFLGKPFRIDELLAVVQRVLRTPTTPGEQVS